MSQIEKHTRCSNVISDIEKWGPNLKSQQPRQSNGSTGQSVTDKNMFSYESLCVCVSVGWGGGVSCGIPIKVYCSPFILSMYYEDGFATKKNFKVSQSSI